MCSLLYLDCYLLIAVRSTKQVGVFLRKCVRTAAKTMVVDRKNQKALALLYLRSGPLEILRTQTLCRPGSQHITDIKDEVVEGKFINLDFLPSTKKTTEYSFKLLLSIYRVFDMFSQVLNFTSDELNRFAEQAKLLKKPLFQKRRWSCGFPPRKTPVAQKHRAVSRQEKTTFSTSPP